MPKVLVIYAHPLTEKGSSTHELYKHFINAYQEANPNDEVVVHNVSEYMPYPLNKFAVSIYNKKLAKCDLDVDESASMTPVRCGLMSLITLTNTFSLIQCTISSSLPK